MVSVPPAASTSQNVSIPSIPELFDPNFLDVLLPALPSKRVRDPAPMDVDVPRNSMMDALNATTHRTRTWNGAETYDSTSSPTLNLFQNLGRQSYGSSTDQQLKERSKLLEEAWKEDSDLSLRIIWCLRSIHDGKSNKEAFYQAYGWLVENHPRTAIANLPKLVEPLVERKKKGKEGEKLAHGYWKDLLNILALAAREELQVQDPKFLNCRREMWMGGKGRKTRLGLAKQDTEAHNKAQEAQVRVKREKVRKEAHAALEEKLKQPTFRALYVAVARLFAEQLTKDLAVLRKIEALPPGADSNGLQKQLSLAAKWAPTPGASHDKVTNISTAISLLLATSGAIYPDAAQHVSDPHRLRSIYQRWVLTSLRSASHVIEPLMSSNRWGEIKYNRVASVCMNNNTPAFFAHDSERFEAYMAKVEQGTKSISGATILPHLLVREAVAGESDPNRSGGGKGREKGLAEMRARLAKMKARVIEAQWATLVDRLKESGALDNSIAVCDVSGSMGYIGGGKKDKHVPPILPAVSLSLLLSELASPPFAGGFISFSQNPQWVKVDRKANGLGKTVADMVSSDWGMNTDFEAVFLRLLLPLAQEFRVKKEDMIKRLFVFSDMQFDQSRSNHAMGWETTHNRIKRAYAHAGYDVPQLVYWNLAGGSAAGTTPVTAEEEGVALMSGFSPSLLKVFMGEEEEVTKEEEWQEVKGNGELQVMKDEHAFNPLNVMKKAVTKKSFDGLVILD